MGRSASNDPTIIISGGDPIDPDVVAGLPAYARVIAADSGLERAVECGFAVDLVIGDMDSVDPDALESARQAGSDVEIHPPDKDATDLDLAIDAAIAGGADRLIMLGGRGGRIAHLLGNALILAAPRLAGIDIEWRLSGAVVIPVTPLRSVRLSGRPGDLVSIVPVAGTAAGLVTTGLRWELHRDTLEPGSTRGISNEMTADSAQISISAGVALVIHERDT